ncbi:hypothetical protein OS493_016061 [Desmophyllum pertusum]|uniref:Homeobox domain-containing protein n=1 Tax=Desmophyllum pertusum TaxID=174260 RepID=A0A9X0A2S2_9CNID|nr:hypothetical protein OS493_016061 [Desmophyllum pertusum]
MSSSMIYCQCNYCGTLQQARALNTSFVPPLESITTVAPLCRKICTNVATAATTSEVSATTGKEAEPLARQREPELTFGIERILYGSSKADLFGTRLTATYTTPHSTVRLQTHPAPWSRPVFSDHQRKTLESRFQLQHYLNKRERYHLSLYIGLTEHQIKVWFQNRRVKFRHGQKAKRQSTKLSRGVPSVGKD